MTFKCSVPGCYTNYRNEAARFTVFSFPRNKVLHQRWVNAMPKENFQSYKYSKVCELHFEPSQIIREASAYDPRTGRTLTAPLAIPRLRKDAVPTRFVPPPAYLLKSKRCRAITTIRENKNQSKEKAPKEETEKTQGSQLTKLLLNDTGIESQKVYEPSSPSVIRELVESNNNVPNIIYLNKLVPSSSSSSLTNSLPSSSCLPPARSLLSSSSLPLSSSLSCVFSQTGTGTESQNVAESSVVIKQEFVESTNEPPPVVIDNILYVEEFVPSSGSSSVSSSLPIFISPSSSPGKAFPISNPDSIIGDESPVANKPERKRKINNAKNIINSATCADHAKVHKLAEPLKLSKRSSEPRQPSRTKESAGGSVTPSDDTQNVTREIFQSLLHDPKSTSLHGSRTSERHGDLFDVFGSFIADNLREMNWDNCAFALRSILDIVFKAGYVKQISEEGTDVPNHGEES